MMPKEVLTGTGLGQRNTKACKLVRCKFSALEAFKVVGRDASFMEVSLKVWHTNSIRFKDPETQQTLIFLTNSTSLPPLTIAALYKSRWQVELFFKWIKQHLRIKKFLGNSENAVKTQIWCAVSTYVLIAIVKKELQLNASLYTLLQILSVSLFEKTEVSSALQLERNTSDSPDDGNQLNLFNF